MVAAERDPSANAAELFGCFLEVLKMIYVDIPMSEFAVRFPKLYLKFATRKHLPPEALLDGSYFVRVSGDFVSDDSLLQLFKKF